jgi:hypothetical protein
MVEPNVKDRFANASIALDALISLEVLRPKQFPKVALLAGGLFALTAAILFPILIKFSETQVKIKQLESLSAKVIVTNDPKLERNLDKIYMNQKRVYFLIVLSELPIREYQGTCQIFDGEGILVGMGQSLLKDSENSLKYWCLYDFNEIDKPGNWTFNFFLDGKKVGQKNLMVLSPP